MRFIVTGVETNGKRFKLVFSTLQYACCINLWRGSVWIEDDNGKRRLFRRVWN